MVAATQTQAATYLDETADVLATAYGVTVDDELAQLHAALYAARDMIEHKAATVALNEYHRRMSQQVRRGEQGEFKFDAYVEPAGGDHDIRAAEREALELIANMEPAKWTMPRNVDTMFTQAEIVEIRERYAAGDATQAEIAEAFGCNQNRISGIVIGRVYPHAGGPITTDGGYRSRALSAADALRIREMYAEGKLTRREIAQDYNVSESTITFIVTGRTYASVGGPITHRGAGIRPPNRERRSA